VDEWRTSLRRVRGEHAAIKGDERRGAETHSKYRTTSLYSRFRLLNRRTQFSDRALAFDAELATRRKCSGSLRGHPSQRASTHSGKTHRYAHVEQNLAEHDAVLEVVEPPHVALDSRLCLDPLDERVGQARMVTSRRERREGALARRRHLFGPCEAGGGVCRLIKVERRFERDAGEMGSAVKHAGQSLKVWRTTRAGCLRRRADVW